MASSTELPGSYLWINLSQGRVRWWYNSLRVSERKIDCRNGNKIMLCELTYMDRNSSRNQLRFTFFNPTNANCLDSTVKAINVNHILSSMHITHKQFTLNFVLDATSATVGNIFIYWNHLLLFLKSPSAMVLKSIYTAMDILLYTH